MLSSPSKKSHATANHTNKVYQLRNRKQLYQQYTHTYNVDKVVVHVLTELIV